MNNATDYTDETLTLEMAETFYRHMEAILVSNLSTTERIVALAFAKSYNWKNESESRCGVYRIAAQTGLGETAVKTAKASLVKKGWLASKRRFGMSNLTVPTLPNGFSYEDEKAKQDALVSEQNETNKARVGKVRKTVSAELKKKDEELEAMKQRLAEFEKAQEAHVKVQGVSEEPEVIPTPQKAVQSLVEASETLSEEEAYGTDQSWETKKEIRPVVKKPVEKTPAKPKSKTATQSEALMKEVKARHQAQKARVPSLVDTVLAQSEDPELARSIYADEAFENDKDDVTRAAYAREAANDKVRADKMNAEW